jgi:UDP-N-acetylglucosamine 2-epimerase (non-hydrolysing)
LTRGAPEICFVFGTRPEAIKLAPVIAAVRAEEGLGCHVCVTAQHRGMLDQVLRVFRLKADVDLNIMRHDQSLAELTAAAITGLDEHLGARRPDMVVVQGDTTTAFCGALAAFYRGTPVAHVEAGLRTGNMLSPWPEEANRVMISRLASLHFAPTESGRANLLREGVAPDAVLVTGNTVVDALLHTVREVERDPPAVPGLPEDLLADSGPELVLVTGHRRENFGEALESICGALADLARRLPDARFVYPVHLNPNVRGPVESILGEGGPPNVHLLEPLAYPEFVRLMKGAALIMTDSGGIQEEAPSLGKPVLVMREVTERPEALEAGTARLVGAAREKIVAEALRLLTDPEERRKATPTENPFGDGRAAGRIVKACADYLVGGRG